MTAGEKAIHSERLLIEIDWLANGAMRYQISKPDTRKRTPHKKYRCDSTGYGYFPSQKNAAWTPGPIGSLASKMEYVERRLKLRRPDTPRL